MVEYILSVNKQVEMRARDQYPNIKEYVLLRRVTVGMKVFCFFLPAILWHKVLNANSKQALPYHDWNLTPHWCSRQSDTASDHSSSAWDCERSRVFHKRKDISTNPEIGIGTLQLMPDLPGGHRTSSVLIRNKRKGWVIKCRNFFLGKLTTEKPPTFLRIASTLCQSYVLKRKSPSNQRLSTCSSCLNPQSVAGSTCALKFQNSIHTRMRLYQNSSRGWNTRSGNPLPPLENSLSVPLFGFWAEREKKNSSGFVHWHWEAERYLGPRERRGEVKNTLINLYPLELGSPQLPPDIRHGYDFNIEFWLVRCGNGRAGLWGWAFWIGVKNVEKFRCQDFIAWLIRSYLLSRKNRVIDGRAAL